MEYNYGIGPPRSHLIKPVCSSKANYCSNANCNLSIWPIYS